MPAIKTLSKIGSSASRPLGASRQLVAKTLEAGFGERKISEGAAALRSREPGTASVKPLQTESMVAERLPENVAAALLAAAGEALSAGRWGEARDGFQATLEIEESGSRACKCLPCGTALRPCGGMVLFAQEDGTWLLTLFGYGPEHRPPTDDAGYLEFLASVAPSDVLAGVVASRSLDEVATHAFPASRRRHYERLAKFPRGLVALGDAISSFNPVYGQGMSVAALEAVALRHSLSSGEDGLSQRYFKASRKIVDTAWDLAIGSDLSLPEVAGERTILTRLSNAWAEHILKAAEHDPYVAQVFGSVTDLLAPPTVLMRPRFMWRVARSRATKHPGQDKGHGAFGPTRGQSLTGA